MIPQPVTDEHIESMLLIAQVSDLLIFFIKNHSCRRNTPRSVKRIKVSIGNDQGLKSVLQLSPKPTMLFRNSFTLWFCGLYFCSTVFVTPQINSAFEQSV